MYKFYHSGLLPKKIHSFLNEGPFWAVAERCQLLDNFISSINFVKKYNSNAEKRN